MKFIRQLLVESNARASEIKSIWASFGDVKSRRFFWVRKGMYLTISCQSNPGNFKSDPRDEVMKFVSESDSELIKLGNIVGAITSKKFEILAFGDRFAQMEQGGKIHTFDYDERFSGISMMPTTLHVSCVPILAARPHATKIYYDGVKNESVGRQYLEYFRLVESGFGVRASRLKKPLLEFINSGNMALEDSVWDELKRLRDYTHHAYNSDETAYEDAVFDKVAYMRAIAADVLVHKKFWGDKTTDRSEKNLIMTHPGYGTDINIVRGAPFSISVAVREKHSGFPIHLQANELNKNYRRIIDRITAEKHS